MMTKLGKCKSSLANQSMLLLCNRGFLITMTISCAGCRLLSLAPVRLLPAGSTAEARSTLRCNGLKSDSNPTDLILRLVPNSKFHWTELKVFYIITNTVELHWYKYCASFISILPGDLFAYKRKFRFLLSAFYNGCTAFSILRNSMHIRSHPPMLHPWGCF